VEQGSQKEQTKMSIVAECHLDIASVQSAWQGLNNLVPLGPITGERDYKHRVQIMDELLDRIGANESHRLMPLLDLVTRKIETYEAKDEADPFSSNESEGCTGKAVSVEEAGVATI